MKDGAWIVAADGRHQWIIEHARWLQDAGQARALGLPEEAIVTIRALPWDFNGPGRVAICLEGMRHGLIAVTFEFVLPLPEVLLAIAPFMQAHLGPRTMVCIHNLETGEGWAGLYEEIHAFGAQAMAHR